MAVESDGVLTSNIPDSTPDRRRRLGLADRGRPGGQLSAVHEALEGLERHDPHAAALAKLRFFAGFEHQRAAEMLGLSRRAADRLWLLARTWLFQVLDDREK